MAESTENAAFESALLDQRMRADRHKGNFESLKAQYLNLQDTHQTMKVEFDSLTDSYDRLHHKSQDIIQTLQKERDSKIIECEELRSQALTPLKLEQLRVQLTDEIEETYKKRMESVESELEAVRSEHNKLKYNHAILKSDYETTVTMQHSVVQELTTKHEAEISSLVEERRSLLARLEKDIPTDLQRIRQLQRDNSEFQQRVKGLLSENGELRAQRESVAAKNDQAHQALSRQIAELQAAIKTIEVERSSLTSQVKTLQTELMKAHQDQHALSEQLTQSKRENTNIKRTLGETEHKFSMEFSELKLKHAEECRELEQERERCVSEGQAIEAQLEALSSTINEQEALLANKESEIEQRVHAAREKEWEKLVVLEKERIELEERVAELQKIQVNSVQETDAQISTLEDKICTLQSQKMSLESELELLKVQSDEKTLQLQTLTTEVQQLTVVHKKHQTLTADHQRLQQSEQELADSSRKMEATAHLLEEHLERVQNEMSRVEEQYKQEQQRERMLWSEERQALTEKMEECQATLKDVELQLEESKRTSKKMQNHYKKKVQELKDSNDVLKAKEDESNAEKESLQKALGLENQKLKRKVTEMQRKHKEFLFVLQHGPHLGVSTSAESHSMGMQNEQEGNVEEVRQKVDELAASQQQHLAALSAFVTHTVISPSQSNHSITDSYQ